LTISSTTRIAGPFVGTGSASVFPFTFKVFAASDLDVIRLNSSTGVETTLVLTTDYTVTLNGNQNTNPGGSVTLVAGALASGFTLTITSDIANLQPTDLTNQGGFYPEVITDSLDRATIQIQQMFEDVGRSLKGPISDGSLNMELPTSAIRASKFLFFDSNGLPSAAAGTNTGNNTSPVSLTLTANNANSGVGRDISFFDYTTQTMKVASGGNLILGDQNAAGDTQRAFDIYNYASGASASSQIRLITHNTSGSPSSIGQLTKYQTGAFSIQNTETNSAAHIRFDVGSSERMRIDSSGRVGIGMTPTTRHFSLFSATNPTFQIVNSTTGTAAGDGGIIYMSGNDMLVTNQEAANLKLETSGTTRVTIDSAGSVGIGTTNPQAPLQVAGQIIYGTVATPSSLQSDGSSNSVSNAWNEHRFQTGGNERLRIETSGDLVLGNVNAAGDTSRQFDIYNHATGASASSGIRLITHNTAGSPSSIGQILKYQTGAFRLQNTDTNAAAHTSFWVGNTERMRITSAGEVFIAGTTDQGPYNLQCNGTGVWGAGAYVNGSDSRIKHDINPIGSCLDIVAAIEPVTFVYNSDWSLDQTVQTGFIAQQLQTALAGQPYLEGIVSQGGEYLNVAYQNIIPLLTKSIQELKAIVESQAARIAALEASA